MKLFGHLQRTMAVMVYIAFTVFIVGQVSDVLDFSFMFENRSMLITGAAYTILISIAAFLCSMLVGFLLFVMTESKVVFLNSMASIYKEIIMGTPLLVLVFVMVYIVGLALGNRSKLFLGFMTLTLYMSPYMTNIFDGAYNAIDPNQFVVMDFYGFNTLQRYRYIIIPQMIKPSLPGLINNLSGIIKGTSILSVIAVEEIFYTVSVLNNKSYRFIEGYFILWIVYLLITIPMSYLAKYFSKQESY